jgi:hypothetical protein
VITFRQCAFILSNHDSALDEGTKFFSLIAASWFCGTLILVIVTRMFGVCVTGGRIGRMGV